MTVIIKSTEISQLSDKELIFLGPDFECFDPLKLSYNLLKYKKTRRKWLIKHLIVMKHVNYNQTLVSNKFVARITLFLSE